MSGHSHWATTKRAKGIKDAARGKVFSKLSKQISIAVKEGGGPDVNANYKLRLVVDMARAANMPKDNIERAISKSSSASTNLSEITYEGFGPGGVNLIIEATTDNKNRTAQEVKNALERSGGSMGGPNSVSFNFVGKGVLTIQKSQDFDNQLLSLIDMGIEDYVDIGDSEIDLFVEPHDLFSTKEKLEKAGFLVTSAKLTKKPLNLVTLSEKDGERLSTLLDTLDTLDDVDEVYLNA